MGTDSFQSHLLLLKAKDLEGESGLNEQQSKRGIKRAKKRENKAGDTKAHRTVRNQQDEQGNKGVRKGDSQLSKHSPLYCETASRSLSIQHFPIIYLSIQAPLNEHGE